MKRVGSLLLTLLVSVLLAPALSEPVTARSSFVTVKNHKFYVDDMPYYYIGTNYWHGSLLGLEKDKRRGLDRIDKSTWEVIRAAGKSLQKSRGRP